MTASSGSGNRGLRFGNESHEEAMILKLLADAGEAAHNGEERKTLELDVNGFLIANDADLLVHVALNGTGVVYVLRDFAAPFIATGQLVPLLEEWMPPPSDGFFLYYPQ